MTQKQILKQLQDAIKSIDLFIKSKNELRNTIKEVRETLEKLKSHEANPS